MSEQRRDCMGLNAGHQRRGSRAGARGGGRHRLEAGALWLALLGASMVPACGADIGGEPGEDEGTQTTSRALSPSGLSLGGSSTLFPLAPEDGYAHVFDGTFTLTNQTNRSVTIDKQMFFFAAPGGFAFFPDLGVWWQDPLPPGASASGGGIWGWSAPLAHLVMRVDGTTSSGDHVAALHGIPLLAPGKASPGPSPYVDDVNIGVQGPIEITTLTSGERWLSVTGTVVDTTQTATEPPSLTLRARNAFGHTVATLTHTLEFSDAPFFHGFLAWAPLPANASVTNVRITASQAIEGGTASQTRTLPVVNASPISIVSPVSGMWMWANGPGETFWHAHTGGPEARYAYDLGVHRFVNGQLQSYAGDPSVNSSYFCWDQPIRAALTGTVVHVQDDLPDNNGNLGDNNHGNNEIIIQHPNNVFTRYAHMRQGTATVHVGQLVHAGTVIALVGNAGNSSEPHLHFHVFKIDATGRQVAVPVTVPGMRSTTGASVSGIPKGRVMYQTP